MAKGVTPVSNLFITEYLPHAPENCVKAYLFGLMRCCQGMPEEDMAGALGIAEAELAEIFAYWQQLGLVNILSGDPLCVEYLEPTAGGSAATRQYSALFSSLQRVLGSRMLSGAELAKVQDWVEVFGMQQETAVLLLEHCIRTKGGSVKMSYMDSVARDWANLGILSPEAAVQHLAEYDEFAARAQKVLKRWRRTRPATQDEIALFKKWVGWGFGDEDILAACAELTGAGQPSFKVLDGVLAEMRLNGATTTAGLSEYRKKQNAAGELARMMFERAGLKKQPSAQELRQVFCWMHDWHMDVELLLLAAEYAKSASSKFAYMAKLAEEWHSGGVATLQQAKQSRKAHERTAGQGKKQSSLSYLQRTYSAEDYQNIGIKLLEDE